MVLAQIFQGDIFWQPAHYQVGDFLMEQDLTAVCSRHNPGNAVLGM
jgi:hypothetical protein